ncbi:MAG: thiamine-phosphate kinase [Candidatus Hadarchaeales archaeon]
MSKRLKDVGESAVLRLARKIFTKSKIVVTGIGDDAAVLSIGGKFFAMTTDMFVGKTSIPQIATPEQIGKKAVVINFSDLAAVGARPIALLFSIAMPADFELSSVERIMRSMEKEARRYGACVVGGDVDEGEDITIAGFAFGIVEGKILTRDRARPGELVGVTGELGSAAAGLDVIRRKLEEKRFEPLIRAQLEPEARCVEGIILGKCKGVTSAIDISDGFAYNLWQIAEESGIGITVEKEKLPICSLVKEYSKSIGKDPYDFALFGGEDYELLFTIKPSSLSELERKFKRANRKFTIVGKTVRGRGVWISEEGKVKRLPKIGFEHFRHNSQNL